MTNLASLPHLSPFPHCYNTIYNNIAATPTAAAAKTPPTTPVGAAAAVDGEVVGADVPVGVAAAVPVPVTAGVDVGIRLATAVEGSTRASVPYAALGKGVLVINFV